jgi:hypothetical protein
MKLKDILLNPLHGDYYSDPFIYITQKSPAGVEPSGTPVR